MMRLWLEVPKLEHYAKFVHVYEHFSYYDGVIDPFDIRLNDTRGLLSLAFKQPIVKPSPPPIRPKLEALVKPKKRKRKLNKCEIV